MSRLLSVSPVRSLCLSVLIIITFASGEANWLRGGMLQSETALESPNEAPESPAKPPIKFERLLVPFQELGSMLTTLPGAGFLSYDEFLEYLAHKREKIVPPPVPAVINQANYAVELGEKLAKVTMELKIRALAKDWSGLTLSFETAALGRWSSDNEDAFLYASGPGQYVFQMPAPGEYTLSLTMEYPVEATSEGHQTTLKFPSVALTSISATLAKPNSTLELRWPGQATPILKQVGRETSASLELTSNLGAATAAILRWYPTTAEKMDDELLLHAQKWLKLHLEDRQLQSDGYFEFEVLKGKLKELEILLPRGDRVLDLSSSHKISDWTLEETGESQTLKVKLFDDVTGRVTLQVHTEREFLLAEDGPTELAVASDADSPVVSIMRSSQAAREVGQLIISTAEDLEVTVQSEQGLSRIVPEDVDKRVAFTNGLAYRFYAGSFSLQAEIRPITPKVTSEQTSLALLTADQILMESIVSLTIERAGIFEVSLIAPAGAEQLEVTGPAVAQHRLQAESNTLLIDLKQKTQGSLQIHLSCVVPVDREADAVELPVFALNNTERNIGSIDVLATSDLEVITDVQQVVSARIRQTPSRFPASYQSPEFAKHLSGAQLVSSWQYQQQPVTLPLTIKVRPARLSAALAHQIQVREELVELMTTLNYTVEYAQLDTFRFKVPGAYAPLLQIELTSPTDTAIKQKTSSEADAENWVTWTVVLQRPVMGNVVLMAKAFLPLENTGGVAGGPLAGAPAVDANVPTETALDGQLTLVLPRPLGLEAQPGQLATGLTQIQGEVGLDKLRSLSVSLQPSSETLEAIDVRELTRLPKSGIAAYRYVETEDDAPLSLALAVTKSEIQEVIKTVIPRALVEIVTNQEPVAMLRFRAQVLTSERQRLVLGLPKNGVSLGVWIDGRQAALEKSPIPASQLHDFYYVSVARPKAAEEPFSLALICRWPLSAAPYNAWGGAFEFPLPALGQESDQNIAIQQLRVAVWTPKDHVLIGQPAGFQSSVQRPVLTGLTTPLLESRDQSSEFNSWIGNSTTGIVDFPVDGRVHDWMKLGSASEVRVAWWSVLPFTAVISGALVVIALLLIKAPWAYRLTLLLLVAFGLSVWALRDSEQVYHLLQMGRYGLVTLVGIWLVGLVGWSSPVSSQPPLLTRASASGPGKTTSKNSTHNEATPDAKPSAPSDDRPSEPPSENAS